MNDPCILVCVTAQKDCARLIRRGEALARKTHAPLHVLHVSSGKGAASHPDAAMILNELFSLAHEAEADMNILYEQDVAPAIARYARSCGAGALVLGPDRTGVPAQLRQLLPSDVQLIVEE